MRWHIFNNYGYRDMLPEDVPKYYHDIIKELIQIRKKLKNPVSSQGYPRPLMPATIRNYQSREQELLDKKEEWKRAIKEMLKYNVLPLNSLVPGKDGLGFIFHLGVMIELPFLSEIVSSANKLVESSLEERDKNCCLLVSTLKNVTKKVEERKAFYIKVQAKSSRDKKCKTCPYYLKAKGGSHG